MERIAELTTLMGWPFQAASNHPSMSTIMLPDHLLDQLEAIAQRESRTPAEVLESLLQDYNSTVTAMDDAPPGTLAALAHSALEAGLSAPAIDTVQRSREILKTEYADYIQRRTSRKRLRR